MQGSYLGPVITLGSVVLGLFFLIMWNRQRVKGKLLAFIVRKDRSVLPKLCELRDDFLIFKSRAYEVYPDFVRICRFPMGWPAFLQELVPGLLYDEEDSCPLDWIHLDDRKGRAMELRAALDENWIRKLVEETAREGGIFGINWRRVLPFLILGIGVVGLIVLFVLKRKAGG